MTHPHACLETAIAALRKGGVIAYPTEGVWGLGCDPRDEAATLRLLALKQREVATSSMPRRAGHTSAG